MITYEKKTISHSGIDKYDSTKNNILLIGKADTYKERCSVINPRGKHNAGALYGIGSELYNAYAQCLEITNEYNIFTANCRTYVDFLHIMDLTLHYNFTYVVPMGITMDETFYNEETGQYEYYIDYFMYLIEEYQSITTIIMTGNHAKDYDNIDDFIEYNNKVLQDYYVHVSKDNSDYNLFEKNGSDIIYVINNLDGPLYANAILAAQITIDDFTKYPDNIDYITYFDLDRKDIDNSSCVFHKYSYLTNTSSIENLVNMRLYEDVYKNALIDSLIKTILRKLDLNKYKGRLYNAYIKQQIEHSVKANMDLMKNIYFKNYEIKNVGFVKTEATAGYIYIELSIMPYGFMEYINVIMEV